MRLPLALLGLLLLAGCARCAPRGCPPGPCPPGPVTPPVSDPREAWHSRAPEDLAIALRTTPKETRWALAQAELRLSDAQIARLREAVVARDKSLEGKTAIITRLMEGLPLTAVTGDSDEWTTLVDVGALEAADAGFDARAKEILSAEQWAKWSGGGFSRAFGVRLPHVPRDPYAGAPFFPLPSADAK